LQQTGKFVAVPVTAYPPILQGAVVLRNASGKQTALDFLQYLQSSAGRNLLATGGLVPSAH
jgi:ABC-type molybdate transport system substrate-binding protein